MAATDIVFKDRVKDTSTTTGTGNLTLAGSPPTGFQSFNTAFGTDTYFFYTIEGGAEWEVGKGHLSASTTLVRDTIYASTNSNNAVDFSAGTKNVFCTIPGTDAQDKWRTIAKPATTSRTTNTTLAADPVLTLTMLANKIYVLDLFVWSSQSSTTPGLKFRYNNSQAPLGLSALIEYPGTAVSGGPNTFTMTTRWNNTQTGETLTSLNGTAAIIRMRIIIFNHATNANTFDFEWAQNTSSADGTHIAFGSYLRYKQIN